MRKKMLIIRIPRRRWNDRYNTYRHNYREWLRKLSIREKKNTVIGWVLIKYAAVAAQECTYSSRTD